MINTEKFTLRGNENASIQIYRVLGEPSEFTDPLALFDLDEHRLSGITF